MKALVIGGAGYIGSHVVKEFLKNGSEVVVYDNLSTGEEINLFSDAKFVKGDILDYENLLNVMKQGFDTVIFLAGKKAVGESMENPMKYAQNNISGAINVLNAMVSSGVNNLVFSSTAAVYGMPEYFPVDENHPTNPISFYGYTKLATEDMMKWYSKTKDLHYTSLRYFNAVGYDVDGDIKGREKNPQNLLPIIMEVLNGQREELCVFGDDYDTIDGTCVRDYIHVSDLATAHYLSSKKMIESKNSYILNLATSKGTSVKQIITATQEISGKKLNVKYVARRKGDPASLIASSNLAKKILGWEAKITDIKDIIKSNL